MKTRQIWWIALVVLSLLIAACGPEMTTPTPRVDSSETESAAAPTPTLASEPSEPPPTASGELPVSADDWNVLGASDAPVTILDYSDFQ